MVALSDSKSSGLMNLNSKVTNLCLRSCIPEFTCLLNLCINKGTFPSDWKAGNVPIPKGDKMKIMGNIRPISLLPSPGKILEHIMHRQMYAYLMEYNLLSPKQTGFRKNFGIQDATIDLVSFVQERFNDKRMFYVYTSTWPRSLDIGILLSKLESLGFEGTFLKLLKRYSTGRRQVTNFNGCISKVGTVEFGVAQGSVLGPLLFSIYMNDLPTIFTILDVRRRYGPLL